MRTVCMIPSHRAPDRFMPPTWKYESAGIRLLACPIDKMNFPRILNPRGAKGGNHTHTSHIDFGVGYPGVRTTFSHMATPLVLYPGFLDKTNFSRILTPRVRYPQDPSTIPTRSHPWTLPGSPGMYRCWGHPAQLSCAHLSPGAR